MVAAMHAVLPPPHHPATPAPLGAARSGPGRRAPGGGLCASEEG
jgi:hypothetical protein